MAKEKSSFYTTDIESSIYGIFIGMIFTGLFFILISLIPGIIGIVNDTRVKYYLYTIPIPIILTILLAVASSPKTYLKYRKLLEEKKEGELKTIAQEINAKGSLALCALYDINPKEAKLILEKYHAKIVTSGRNIGYISKLTTRIREDESFQEIRSKKENIQPMIKITKAYFIKDKNELGKGMITKTQLTMDSEIVICPFCSNMAKKELLAEWLKEKKACPICSSELTIADCPIVDIRG